MRVSTSRRAQQRATCDASPVTVARAHEVSNALALNGHHAAGKALVECPGGSARHDDRRGTGVELRQDHQCETVSEGPLCLRACARVRTLGIPEDGRRAQSSAGSCGGRTPVSARKVVDLKREHGGTEAGGADKSASVHRAHLAVLCRHGVLDDNQMRRQVDPHGERACGACDRVRWWW